MRTNPTLLVIDDDVELCQLLSMYLVPEGYELVTVHDGREGLEQALSKNFDLVILDVMLPGMNGFDVLRQYRAKSDSPVLMLTARGEEVDRIVGLEIGADDYLPKPFNPRELSARIRAILRRAKPQGGEAIVTPPGECLKVGDAEMDLGARSLKCGGKTVDLTSVEFAIIEALLRNAGSVVARDTLAEIALGRELSPFDRSLDVHISNIRKKLGCLEDGGERIKTVRGAGYVFAIPSA